MNENLTLTERMQYQFMLVAVVCNSIFFFTSITLSLLMISTNPNQFLCSVCVLSYLFARIYVFYQKNKDLPANTSTDTSWIKDRGEKMLREHPLDIDKLKAEMSQIDADIELRYTQEVRKVLVGFKQMSSQFIIDAGIFSLLIFIYVNK